MVFFDGFLAHHGVVFFDGFTEFAATRSRACASLVALPALPTILGVRTAYPWLPEAWEGGVLEGVGVEVAVCGSRP